MSDTEPKGIPFPLGYIQKLPNENPLIHLHGEPISLTSQTTDPSEMIDKSLKAIADMKTLEKHDPESELKMGITGSSELQRQAKMSRLAVGEKPYKIDSFDTQIAEHQATINKMGIIDQVIVGLGGERQWLTDTEAKKQEVIQSRAAFLKSLEVQKQEIGLLQESIVADPAILEKVISTAYEEAQAIQRIALGLEIRQNNGGNTPDASQAQKFVDLANKGDLTISKNSLERAIGIHALMVRHASHSLKALGGKMELTQEMKDLHTPLAQIQES